MGEHLTFKGGTSLSKAWKLIQRFSEDIDLIGDKEVLGFGGDAAPDKTPSNKQRKVRLAKLMDACRDWVQGTLQPALAARLRTTLGEAGWKLDVDPEMPAGQCLLFHYPSVFMPAMAGYPRPVVKIELGARSDDWPHVEKYILPYPPLCDPAFPWPRPGRYIPGSRPCRRAHFLGKGMPASRGIFSFDFQFLTNPDGFPVV